jgi:hypothetical protein
MMTNIRIANIKSIWPLSLSTTQQINARIKTKKDSHWMTYDICESGQPKKKNQGHIINTPWQLQHKLYYFKKILNYKKLKKYI